MLPPAPAVIRTACLLIPHKVLLIILIVGAAIIAAAGLGMWLHKRSTYRLLNFFAVHVSITSKLKSRDNESILKGIVHQLFFYRSNLIFWIVMGCGIADFVRMGL